MLGLFSKKDKAIRRDYVLELLKEADPNLEVYYIPHNGSAFLSFYRAEGTNFKSILKLGGLSDMFRKDTNYKVEKVYVLLPDTQEIYEEIAGKEKVDSIIKERELDGFQDSNSWLYQSNFLEGKTKLGKEFKIDNDFSQEAFSSLVREIIECDKYLKGNQVYPGTQTRNTQ